MSLEVVCDPSKSDLLIRSGSHLYGCDTPESDVDLRGFFVEQGIYLLGREKFDQHEDRVSDTVIWGFKKFFHLLEKSSPNTLEILFAPINSYQILTDVGRLMVDKKNLFLSKDVASSIKGFSYSEWLKSQLLTKNKETGEVCHSSSVVGARRKESHASFGYSLKNACHSIRLLEQGIDLLKNHTIAFPRPNASFLKDIRNGDVPFSDLEKIYNERVEEFKTAEENTSIPLRMDKNKLDDLYYEIVGERIIKFFQNRKKD